MANIRRCNHHVCHPKSHRLCCQNHIAVQRLVIRSRLALLTRLCPEHHRLTHGSRGERQVLQESGQPIEPRETTDSIGSQ
jgi:hypothetical protein